MITLFRTALTGAALSICCSFSPSVSAQQEPAQQELAQPGLAQPGQSCVEGACTISYDAAFFTRYAPVTALDMVNNLPGFALDDGDRGTRGFGGAAGNVVINGARVSAKTETPTAILSRIPATDIARIDVIRGQVAGLDIRGQNVIANIIRTGTSSSGAWTAGARTFQPDDNVYPYGEISYSTDLAGTQVTVGVAGRQFQTLVARRERVLGPDALPLEKRFELSNLEGERIGATLNASTTLGQTRLGVNLGRASFSTEGGESSRRFPQDGATPFLLFQGDGNRIFRDEFGFDAERPLSDNWRGKIIGLYGSRVNTEPGSLILGPLDEIGVTQVLTRERTATQELIGRLELDYSGFIGHTIEMNFEASNNSLDSEFSLSALENGVLLPQPVPGANSEVEEERFDVLVSDAFQWGEVSIDAGIGAETSTITQIGGFSGDRSFFFWKPSLNMSYAPKENSQWRLRALREVGQLDFQDFVSGADLGDGELALGNPNLAPETTVTVDLSYEVRGDDFGIGTVTVFHNWIDDVNDLLPLSGVLEVPGNIGSATRAGILGELTMSLDSFGLPNGRMDASAQWQTSRVDDPLTLLPRALSNERQWEASMSIRQDIQAKRLAWGVTMFARDTFPLYGLDEIDIQGQRADMDVFIETRAFQGLRIRLTVEDLFRDGESRDRRVFAGDRSVAPVAFREVREQSQARIISLQVSGDF